MQKKADVIMQFKTFVELYEKDVRPSLKENTWLTKEHIINEKILPYFAKRRLCDITAKDIIAWQNEMRNATSKGGKKLSQTYLKTIHNQLSALFNHAVKFYGLKVNPAATVGNMGKAEYKEMLFWTTEEYTKFANEMMDKQLSYYAFFMKSYGIEWEKKGTHEKHLSVLDFKKQERTAELEKLESEIADKKDEFEMYQDRIDNFTRSNRAA